MTTISKNITFKEATMTQTRIANIPSEEEIAVMRITAEKVFEPIRMHFNKAISITSFFRSAKVNAKVGGAKTSQHVRGEAIDIDAQILGGLINKDIFDYAHVNMKYDQLIWEGGNDKEPGWVHISYTGRYPLRQETLKMEDGGYIRI